MHTEILTIRELEIEWARYKYWVMARSQKSYNKLRVMFKDGITIDEFTLIIDELATVKPTVQTMTNAAYHVFGYFKKVATDSEKKSFLQLLADYEVGKVNANALLENLHQLAIKYQIKYLLDSYFFDEII